ncbi:hypothetical protein [Prosthecobacter sp.]|uniref:hypothetical protein n=1 Tax=Prosthecobacter sp. TaxID=1965333 RepID=UPI002ABD1219|nr:hypothetical protein [Prosthecobacter sp.]MDZ4404906.1 hypothetical protein [Prosthecobacter sp.]
MSWSRAGHGGLMRLVRRRWLAALARAAAMKGLVEPVARHVRALCRAWRRQALGAWLVGWLPAPWPLTVSEPALPG